MLHKICRGLVMGLVIAGAPAVTLAVPLTRPRMTPPPQPSQQQQAQPEAPPPKLEGLRPLTGTVGFIERGLQPLDVFIERLSATMFSEQAHDTVSPYMVSIANSLEALDPKDRRPGSRAERALLRAYVTLSALDGPQLGRLSALYAAGLSQALGVPVDEVAVTAPLQKQLRQIGSYAAGAAGPLIDREARSAAVIDREARSAAVIDRQGRAEQAALRTELALNQGRYAEAVQQAQSWEKQQPGAVAHSFLLGAQLLAGQAAARTELQTLAAQTGPQATLAMGFLRRAAREALVARLGPLLTGPGASPEVQRAATGWRKPAGVGPRPAAQEGADEYPLHEACLVLGDKSGKAGKPEAARADCSLLMLDGAGLLGKGEIPWPQGADSKRAALLRLARGLGQLVGLLGKRRSDDPKVRAAALAEVLRLLPKTELPPEEAGAVALLAQIGATAQPGLAAPLQGPVDKYLQSYPCSPLSVPLLLGRFGAEPQKRLLALRAVVPRCEAAPAGPRRDEALRLQGLLLLAMEPGSELAHRALGRLPGRAASGAAGRFLLAAADAEMARAQAAATGPSAAALAVLQRRYEEASAQLLPWDGTELKGHAEAQVAALLVWRHQLERKVDLLREADAHLRWAQLVVSGEDAALVEALEVYTGREQRLASGKAATSPHMALERLQQGVGRRELACELARTALAAKDGVAAAKYRALAGTEALPGWTVVGQPRLQAALGTDETLRVQVRGEIRLVTVPPCK